MSEPIRVLITDDHFIVRQGLRLILKTADDIELVGEAVNGEEAHQLTTEHQPHVVLMDLRMPVMNGLTAIEELQQKHPHVAVIILTTYNEDEMLLPGLQLGARGYLLRDTERETLLKTIRAAARGESLFKPDILQRTFAAQAATPPPRSRTPQENPLDLSRVSWKCCRVPRPENATEKLPTGWAFRHGRLRRISPVFTTSLV